MHLKVLLVFLTTVGFTEAITCQIMSMTVCTNFKMLDGFKFRAFIPRNEFEDYCRDMDAVLECIYQPSNVDGCPLAELFYYDMKRNLSNAVCHDGEYLKHVDCLGNKELETQVTESCIRFDSNVGCDNLKSIRACTNEKILSICGDQDKKYMDFLVFQFLEPYSMHIGCEMDEPEIKIKAPTTTAMTSKTMSTKSSMGTTTKGQNNTTPGAGSILKASPLLIFTVLLTKLSISITNVFSS